MELIKRLGQLLFGANSKPETRTEQSEMARKSIRTVEVMVDTDEIVLHRTAVAGEPHKTVKQTESDLRTS